MGPAEPEIWWLVRFKSSGFSIETARSFSQIFPVAVARPQRLVEAAVSGSFDPGALAATESQWP